MIDESAAGDGQSPAEPGSPFGRRLLLGLLGLGVGGTLVGSHLQNAMEQVLGPLEIRDPTGLLSLLPIGDSFRFYSVTGSAPNRNASDYALKISGLVTRPVTLTLADLQAMPQTALVRDFQCVTGWRVPSVHWSGVQLSHILDAAGVSASATAIRLTSFDGLYTESLTLEQARHPDVIVALRMLDKPVSHNHGGPVRLYVASMYGYKSVKWLDGIEVTAKVIPGYWEPRGYSIDGYVGASNGRDDDPTSP